MKKIITKFLYLFRAIFWKKDNVCPYCSKSSFDIIFKKMGVVDMCYCKSYGSYWTSPTLHLPKFSGHLYKVEGLTMHLPQSGELKKMLCISFISTDKYYVPVAKWLKENVERIRFLDFGSSWGYVLCQAKQLGFNAVGAEIAEDRRNFGINHFDVDIRPDIKGLLKNGDKMETLFAILKTAI